MLFYTMLRWRYWSTAASSGELGGCYFMTLVFQTLCSECSEWDKHFKQSSSLTAAPVFPRPKNDGFSSTVVSGLGSVNQLSVFKTISNLKFLHEFKWLFCVFQWHRTPTTQETDGFQVKRPGDVSVRCTLLLMLDYQVRATKSHSGQNIVRIKTLLSKIWVSNKL